MTSTSTGESDAEFLARMEAEDAAAFASAVAEWRAEREAGGGAARVVEFGGDFAADSEAAGDDGLEGVDAEWLAGDDEGEERRMQLIRNGGKRSSAEVEAAELEAANLPEQFALACVTVGQGDDGGDDAPSGRPPSDVWAAARCGSAAGLAPFLPAQCDALDATGLSPLYAYRALEPQTSRGTQAGLAIGLLRMCSGRASDRHHAVDAERTEAVCALLSAGANPAAVCDGQTFATAGSNPRPADQRAGRSATHTSGPRLGQAVALRGDARRRRDRRDAARRRRCAGDVRDAGRGRSAAVGTRRGGGLRDAGQAPDALELKGDVNTKVRYLRRPGEA